MKESHFDTASKIIRHITYWQFGNYEELQTEERIKSSQL